MTTGKALNGKPYAGNPHVRFDEGEVASAATPRRGFLLYETKTIRTTIAAVLTIAASAMAPSPLRAAGFSICAVGDSITQGSSSTVAHRVALESVLNANNWSVEWKGTQANSSWGSSQPCEGYSGNNAEQVAAKYVSKAASVVADVLLLHAGHNYNVDPDTSDPAYMPEAGIVAAATNAHAQIIAAARAQNPNVIVLYAQVITSGKLPKYSYIPALNSGIAALAAELNTAASPVVAVDMADGWDYATDCVSDMVHPNAAGANKMAAKWFAALEAQVAAGKLTVVLKERTPVSIARDITLGQDTDWRGNGPVNIEPNATVNLNGHKLYVDGVSGGGAVFSAGHPETASASGTPPDGEEWYDAVPYVETPADNAGYVDTFYYPLSTDRAEMRIKLGNVSAGPWLFSARTSWKQNGFDFEISSSKASYAYGANAAVNVSGVAAKTYDIILDGGAGYAVVNSVTQTFASASFTCDKTLSLFGKHDSADIYPAQSTRLYSFRVKDADGNVKVDIVPVRRCRDGAVGLYDTVRKLFLTLSSGELIAPVEYEELAWVATAAVSSPNTYIDTLYKPAGQDRMETKVNIGDWSGKGAYANRNYIFSTGIEKATRTFSCYLFHPNAQLVFDHWYSDKSKKVTHQTVFDAEAKAQDHVIVLDGLTLKSSVDGEESTGTHESFSQLVTNTVLFAGVETSYQNKILGFASNLRMYYFNIRDQYGCSMVEFVPSRRISDGAVGFFDRIRGIFFAPPDGTNPLVAGDVAIRRYVDVRDLTQPGGTCAMPTPDTTSNGTVANLFNDNFWYQTDETHRVLLDTTYHPLPLRVDYDFGEGNAKAVNMYRIHAAYNLRAPGAWVFYGSNDPSAYNSTTDDGWVALDARDSQTDWYLGGGSVYAQACTKVFANDTAYRFYRMKITGKKDEGHRYFDLVQLEYFRVEPTGAPGELHVDVAVGKAVTNATVAIGGDMKVVKDGFGSFTSAKTGPFYTGGTEIAAGTLVNAVPFATSLTVAEDAVLGFALRAGSSAPVLALDVGSSIPSSLNVSVLCDDGIRLEKDGVVLTFGYDFRGTAVNFLNPSKRVKKVFVDGSGNLVVRGPSGFMLIVK